MSFAHRFLFIIGLAAAEPHGAVGDTASTFSVGSEANSSMRFLMWNPHWQCFAWDYLDCKQHVEQTISGILLASDIDFAAVVMLEDPKYSLPEGWAMINHTCGSDIVHLIFNTR